MLTACGASTATWAQYESQQGASGGMPTASPYPHAGIGRRAPDLEWDEIVHACGLVVRNRWRQLPAEDPGKEAAMATAKESRMIALCPDCHQIKAHGSTSTQLRTVLLVTARLRYERSTRTDGEGDIGRG